jgi:hypothetical protein
LFGCASSRDRREARLEASCRQEKHGKTSCQACEQAGASDKSVVRGRTWLMPSSMSWPLARSSPTRCWSYAPCGRRNLASLVSTTLVFAFASAITRSEHFRSATSIVSHARTTSQSSIVTGCADMHERHLVRGLTHIDTV